MKILALETSAKSVSVAVTEDGALLSQAYQNRGLTHSVTLMPLLDGMLRTAGLSMDDMDAVAVACGPGSFTGIRIGISAAKGLAWARELPCCGVSTLEAMAFGVTDFEGIVAGAMDARRRQIYNAFFRCENGSVTRLCADRAVSVEQAAQELSALPEREAEENDIAYGYRLLEAAGKKRGFLISGGEVDTERMAKILLDEFRSAKLGRFTLELP